MGLMSAFKTWFNGASAVPVREAAGTTADDDEGWRRLTGDAARALSPMTQDRMHELAVYLWRSNPLANRLVELPMAYLLAEGVTIQVDDEDAQGWVDAWWSDPINRMDIKLPKKVRELALFGEQCYPVFVNPMNGHMRLGYLDPGIIATVVTDPDNVEQPIGIVTKRDRRGVVRRFRIIVNGPETMFSRRTQEIRQTFADGECFYYTVNDLSSAPRGQSDLLADMDWLDAYDQGLFGEMERWNFLRTFIWDVTLKGATQEEVDERARKITPPKPASMRVHNEQEEWKALAPTLQGGDVSETARLFRNHVLGGSTIPEHWFGGGGDVNRASAAEMSGPTFKVFAMRQAYVGYMLEEMATYQVWRRLDPTGPLPDPADFDPSLKPRIVWPAMLPRDETQMAAALAQTVVAASAAVDKGLLSRETAAEVVALAASRLGLEVDATEELQRADADRQKAAEADALFPDLADDPTNGADPAA